MTEETEAPDDPRAADRYNQERGRAWQQRWATPGDDPFEQWFWTMFRYFNRKVDPEILAIYRKMLGSIPIPELEAVFEQYIMKDDISAREPPKVNVLYAMWRDRKDVQERKRTARRSAKQRDVLEERDELRSKMYPAIAFAILGPSQYMSKPSDTPDWMRSIAKWTVDQMRAQHGELEFHELTENERQAVFDRGLELFDQERDQREGHPEGAGSSGGDPVR